MAIGRKSPPARRDGTGKQAARSLDVADRDVIEGEDLSEETRDTRPDADGPLPNSRRIRQGIVQFPMQILVPEETRNALRQRSEDTGASIRHIILRSLAADGFPVPRLTRRRD